MQNFDVNDDADIGRLYCNYTQFMCFACVISCRWLGRTEGKCWFYDPGACAGCHTSINIPDVLICIANGVYETVIWLCVWAAPLRRNLRTISS